MENREDLWLLFLLSLLFLLLLLCPSPHTVQGKPTITTA
jgi:hypothetical protein